MIELISFRKKYGKNELYTEQNIRFPDNSISFLMGKNGCGKTTLLKCISGLEDYDGKILFNDQKIEEVRKECFVIWDDTPFYLNLNGIKNLVLLSEGRNEKNQMLSKSKKYLEQSILKRKVKTYSYGQRKKLALALCDILEPKYIIMDEVSNGLDIDTMDELADHLNVLKVKSTILLTGHQFSFYEKVAEHIFIKREKNIEYVSPESRNGRSLEEIYHG